MVRALKQTMRTPGVTVHENTFVADIVWATAHAAGSYLRSGPVGLLRRAA